MENKIPCEDCITLSICKAEYLTNELNRSSSFRTAIGKIGKVSFRGRKSLQQKCCLLDEWIQDSSISEGKRMRKIMTFHKVLGN